MMPVKKRKTHKDECLRLFRLIEFHRLLTLRLDVMLNAKSKTYAIPTSEFQVIRLMVNVVGCVTDANHEVITKREEVQRHLDKEKLQMVSKLSKMIQKIDEH